MVSRLVSCALAAGLVLIVPLQAGAEETARLALLEQAFARGEYAVAETAAAQPGSADALALSARAILADVICAGGEPDLARLKEAERLARAAITLAPRHIEGRLQLAIALSLQIRSMDLGQARRSGYGEQARALAEGVLEDDPDNAFAHTFLSVWHVEVRRRGGPLGASILGASLREAEAHYRAASALTPDDAGVHWQYARALAAFDLPGHAGEIGDILARAQDCRDDSALEQVMKARAMELAGRMATETVRATEAWAKTSL